MQWDDTATALETRNTLLSNSVCVLYICVMIFICVRWTRRGWNSGRDASTPAGSVTGDEGDNGSVICSGIVGGRGSAYVGVSVDNSADECGCEQGAAYAAVGEGESERQHASYV